MGLVEPLVRRGRGGCTAQRVLYPPGPLGRATRCRGKIETLKSVLELQVNLQVHLQRSKSIQIQIFDKAGFLEPRDNASQRYRRRKRYMSIYLIRLDRFSDNISEFLDCVLVSRESVPLCMVEHVSSIWVADVVESQGPMDIGVERAN